MSYSKTASDNCDFGFRRTIIFLHLVFAEFFSKAHEKSTSIQNRNSKITYVNTSGTKVTFKNIPKLSKFFTELQVKGRLIKSNIA